MDFLRNHWQLVVASCAMLGSVVVFVLTILRPPLTLDDSWKSSMVPRSPERLPGLILACVLLIIASVFLVYWLLS